MLLWTFLVLGMNSGQMRHLEDAGEPSELCLG